MRTYSFVILSAALLAIGAFAMNVPSDQTSKEVYFTGVISRTIHWIERAPKDDKKVERKSAELEP